MMTAKLSKSSVLTAARSRWKNCDLRENPKAMTATQKAERLEQFKAAMYARDEAQGLLRQMKNPYPDLLAAARFAVDVEAGNPSLDQLRTATEATESWESLLAEKRDAEQEMREKQNGLHCSRWDIYSIETVSGLAAFSVVHASGDTLEELMAKIEART